jgi:uncharacterized surface protein with fasciclin (FAS1) repeats
MDASGCIQSVIGLVREMFVALAKGSRGPRRDTKRSSHHEDQTTQHCCRDRPCSSGRRHCRRGADGRRRPDVRQPKHHSNAVNSKDHTTLVAAVKAGGLVETLEGSGPFTVFAPTNAAFAALPSGTVETLLKPENKGTLDKILTYHVVPGRLDSMMLDQQIAARGGKVVLKTVQGEPLTVQGSGKNLMVTDEKGGSARITIADVYQSNGVIQVVDKVLIPN